MMQTQIPEGLRALMQASQILQQSSAPVVQTPVGPKPTVAGMVSQGLQQVAQDKALPQIGQQAGIAGQIQAQRMAQQQQMAQDPQAIAQMAAQMMQRPEDSGVATIPTNMQFKGGGIVGYNGEDDSYVMSGMVTPPEAQAERVQGLQQVLETMDPSDPRYQRIKNAIREVFRSPETSEMTYFKPPPPKPVLPDEFLRAPGAGGTARSAPQYSDLAQIETGLGGVPSTKAPPVSTAGAKAAATSGAVTGATTGIAVPSSASIMSTATGMAPDLTKSDFFKQLQTNAQARENWLSQQPNLEQEGIKLLQQTAQEREEALQASKKNDNFRRFMAAMNTIRYGSNDYVNLMDNFDKRDETNRKAALAEQQAILKFKEAEQARQAGKFDRADALAKIGLELFKDSQKNQVSMFGHVANLEGGIYGAQMRSADVRTTEAGRSADRAESLKQREEAAKGTAMNRLRTIIETIDKDIVTEQRKFEENPIVKMAQYTKDPKQLETVADLRKELERRLKPLREQREDYVNELKNFPGWGVVKKSD